MEILLHRYYKNSFDNQIYMTLYFAKDQEYKDVLIYQNIVTNELFTKTINQFQKDGFILLEQLSSVEYYGILADHQIKELCENGLVEPYDETLVNPSSLDVRLGFTAMKDKSDSLLKKFCIVLNKLKFLDDYFLLNEIENLHLLKFYFDYRKVLESKNYFEYFDFTKYSEINPYWLKPKECLLISTLEKFDLPPDICSTLKLKSSRAREGLNHALAGWVDNEFNGVLTLEITNVSNHSIPIYPQLKIGQLVLNKTLIPKKTYKNGRYSNQNKVIQSLD